MLVAGKKLVNNPAVTTQYYKSQVWNLPLAQLPNAA
jgi:hypothetical protein